MPRTELGTRLRHISMQSNRVTETATTLAAQIKGTLVARRRLKEQRIQNNKPNRESALGREACSLLDQELQTTPIPQIAEEIKYQWTKQVTHRNVHAAHKKGFWEKLGEVLDAGAFIDAGTTSMKREYDHWQVTPKISRVYEPVVNLNDDGSYTNRSLTGIKVSYDHLSHPTMTNKADVLTVSANAVIKKTEEIVIGIGYVSVNQIPIDLRGTISPNQTQGIKAYIVRNSHAQAQAVPITHPEGIHALFPYISAAENQVAPTTILQTPARFIEQATLVPFLAHAFNRNAKGLRRWLSHHDHIPFYIHNRKLTKMDKDYLFQRDRETFASGGSLRQWDTHASHLKRAKKERAKQREPGKPTPLISEKRDFSTTSVRTAEQKKQRNIHVAQVLHNQLRTEEQERQLYEIADHIRNRMWGDRRRRYHISSVKRVNEMNIIINDDGGVINRSRVGEELSHRMLANKVFFGIGYVGDRKNMIPGTHQVVSSADLKRGVKVWIIEHTTSDGKKKIIHIPFALSESRNKFYETVNEISRSVLAQKFSYEKMLRAA